MFNEIFNKDINSFLKENVVDDSVALIIADPPYNLSIAPWDTFDSQKSYFLFMKSWLKLAYKKLKDDGSIYLFNNQYNSAKLLPILEKIGFNYIDWIVWYKKDGFNASRKKYVNNQETILFLSKSKNFVFNYDDIRIPYFSKNRIEHAKTKGILKNNKRWFPNEKGRLCTNVWEFSSYRHNNKENGRLTKTNHPTPKPQEMIKRMILASSNENDLVLDLFFGSGTASLLAKELKRNSLGCDSDKIFFDLASDQLINTRFLRDKIYE